MTDVENSHVIKRIVYTGNDMVHSSITNTEEKSIISVIESLCGTLIETYNTIYIDILYKLIEILISLYDMFLFSMGKCMKNCTPKGLTTKKRPLYYKKMSAEELQRIYIYLQFSGGEGNKQIIGWMEGLGYYLLPCL